MKKSSDFELMQKIKKGLQPAFVELIQRHQQAVFRFFCHMGVYREESEDLTQEVFLKIFSYRDRYRPIAKFTTFLYMIARRVLVDWRRKNTGTLLSSSLSENISDGKDNISTLEDQLDIQYALNLLPEAQREVLVMSLYQHLKYREISEILEIPLGTVKSRIFNAYQHLREILDGEKVV